MYEMRPSPWQGSNLRMSIRHAKTLPRQKEIGLMLIVSPNLPMTISQKDQAKRRKETETIRGFVFTNRNHFNKECKLFKIQRGDCIWKHKGREMYKCAKPSFLCWKLFHSIIPCNKHQSLYDYFEDTLHIIIIENEGETLVFHTSRKVQQVSNVLYKNSSQLCNLVQIVPIVIASSLS